MVHKLLGVGVLVFAVIVAALAMNGTLFSTTQTFEPQPDQDVMCSDYDFQCCGLRAEGYETKTVKKYLFDSSPITFTCNAPKCEIVEKTAKQGTMVLLDGREMYYSTLPRFIQKGQTISTSYGEFVFSIRPWTQKLVWCAKTPCTDSYDGIRGVNDVSGADGCHFNYDRDIYKSDGTLVNAQSTLTGKISYTTPIDTCIMVYNQNQYVCGKKYNQCMTDADCAAGRPYTVVRNGVTLGASINNGYLEVYGCKTVGQAPSDEQTAVLPGEARPVGSAFQYGRKCQVIDSSQRAECIPGSSSCGTGMICDVATFTCKQSGTVSCRNDAECGIEERYNPETKSFVRPYCENAGTTSSSCGFKTTRTVECAYSHECPNGFYCDTDYKCKERVGTKIACPYTCCDGDPNFFDKAAPPGMVCCPGGRKVAPTLDACFQGSDSPQQCAGEGQSPSEVKPCCPGFKAKAVGGLVGVVCTAAAPGFELGELGEWLPYIFLLIVVLIFIAVLLKTRKKRRGRR